MVATNSRTVTAFGGTGFLGRRIVRHLRYREFPVRIASRHPNRGRKQFGPDDAQLQFVAANIHDERSVADALAGSYGVVNAISLYLEQNIDVRIIQVLLGHAKLDTTHGGAGTDWRWGRRTSKLKHGAGCF